MIGRAKNGNILPQSPAILCLVGKAIKRDRPGRVLQCNFLKGRT